MKNMGRDGDTELAHVNPEEKRARKAMGGSGTINPKTGLREFAGGRAGGVGREGVGGGFDGPGRGGSQRDGGRDDLAGAFGIGLEGARARASKRSAEAQKEIDKAFGGDRDGGITIERRKSVIDEIGRA